MSGPEREEVGPAVSAGHEDAERRTPTGIEHVPDFASDEAAEAWLELGRPSLVDREPSGKTGFTVADVRSAAEED